MVKHWLNLVRWGNLVIIAVCMYAIRFGVIYPFLNQVKIPFQLNELAFLSLVLSTLFIAAGGYIINDYIDQDADEYNRPDKLIINKHINEEVALNRYYIISFIGLLLSIYPAFEANNFNLILIQAGAVGALYFYATAFKAIPFLGNAVVALMGALVPLTAGLYDLLLLSFNQEAIVMQEGVMITLEDFPIVLSVLFRYIIGFSVLAFLLHLIREMVKDMEDEYGDNLSETTTTAVVWGAKTVGIVSIGFTMVLVGLISGVIYFQYKMEDVLSGIYLGITILLPSVFVIMKLLTAEDKKDYHKIGNLLKLMMLFGILYAPVVFYRLYI